VRALREAGVPSDAIAGTSMGSIIGAECALGWTDAEMRARNHEAFIERHPLLDYTLPLVAMLSGRGVTRMLRGLFDDVQIEDLWLTYAAVASNLTDGTVLAGSRGLLRKYIRASCSVPGILPPVSDNGQLLVDGGVLNNIPADIVRDVVGPGVVIAVNVNPSEGLRASDELGDVLEGWSIAWRRVNPFRKSLAIPNIHDMLERMTMLASIQQAAGVVQATADLYLHPPTDMVRFLDWHAMDAHIERGYEYARPLVAAWAEQSGYAGTAPWSTG